MTIDILINVVSDAMEATQEYRAFCRNFTQNTKFPSKAPSGSPLFQETMPTVWGSCMNGRVRGGPV